MNLATRKRIIISAPHIIEFVLGVLVIWITFREPLSDMHLRVHSSSKLLRPLGPIMCFMACFHYAVTPRGIWTCFLCIPVRLIRWDKISTAELLCNWKVGRFDSVSGRGIHVTLYGCPMYDSQKEILNFFQIKHPFTSLFIPFSHRREKRFVAVFQSYYPELFFPDGYDTSRLQDKDC